MSKFSHVDGGFCPNAALLVGSGFLKLILRRPAQGRHGFINPRVDAMTCLPELVTGAAASES
jgi:hypothetical protein